jgi:hypothetical protein
MKFSRQKSERLPYQNTPESQAVAHACNPSYSGGRDQKDHFKVSPSKTLASPISQQNGWQVGGSAHLQSQLCRRHGWEDYSPG